MSKKAITHLIIDNCPVDYLLHEKVDFRSEETACAAADKRLVFTNARQIGPEKGGWSCPKRLARKTPCRG